MPVYDMPCSWRQEYNLDIRADFTIIIQLWKTNVQRTEMMNLLKRKKRKRHHKDTLKATLKKVGVDECLEGGQAGAFTMGADTGEALACIK